MFVQQVRKTLPRDSFGGVLLEVDDHLMEGPGLAHHLSMG